MVGGDGWTKHIKESVLQKGHTHAHTVEPPTVEGLGEATACVGGCVERVSLLVDARSRPDVRLLIPKGNKRQASLWLADRLAHAPILRGNNDTKNAAAVAEPSSKDRRRAADPQHCMCLMIPPFTLNGVMECLNTPSPMK